MYEKIYYVHGLEKPILLKMPVLPKLICTGWGKSKFTTMSVWISATTLEKVGQIPVKSTRIYPVAQWCYFCVFTQEKS